MAMYSPDEVVSSVFKKFEGQWITPEFIRDESNRLSDAISNQRPGDPGRTTRSFADKGIVQKDNPTKASAYCFNPNLVKDDIFLNYPYLYEHPDFNQELYDALNYVDSFRENMVKNSLSLNQAKRIIGGLNLGNENSSKSSFTPTQVIYYGVPGSGKSNKIKEQLKSVPEFQKIRCVFHPEYTNADFVGQIKPVVENGKVEYKFTPGPFAKILRRAYLNPTIPFYLVIEEINRGNAAAIFGDVFQLCDRINPGDDEDDSGYGLGWSSYFTENADLSDYIRDIASLEADKLESHSDAVMQTHSYSEVKDSAGNPISLNATSYMSLEIKRSDFEGENLRFSENTAIRLPPNLSILATMNTSDQNVFTLDNAFQRRFAMKMIPNVLDESSAQYNMLIDGTGVCWGKFREWINKKVNEAPFAVSTEDKCLGGWFICGEKESEDKCRPFDKVEFAEKVLKYLWDDAFKRRRPDIFESNVKSLSDLISRFCEGDGFDSFTAVFKMNDADMAALKAVSLNPPAATAEPVTETA